MKKYLQDATARLSFGYLAFYRRQHESLSGSRKATDPQILPHYSTVSQLHVR